MMIDWLTFRIPCNHIGEIAGGAMVSYKDANNFNSGVNWFFTKPLSVQGSHDSNVRIKTSAFGLDSSSGTELRIDGNLIKFFQGHNLFGSTDIVGLVCDFMDHICSIESLGLCPTDFQRRSWREGNFELSRVDLTCMYLLNNRNDVLSWISSAEYSATLSHRGRGQLTKGSTLYFGKHSRRWSLKFYSKGQEINCKGHRLSPFIPFHNKLLEYAEPALRSELTLRSMMLKDTELQFAANWPRDADGVSRIFEKYLVGLNMSDSRTVKSDQLDELPSGVRLAYQSWLEGHDLKNILSRPTFYRYRKQLLLLGVDIATVLPREKSNVVPLVRVLEAIPMGIPDWAYGTPIYHQPHVS
jgi:II/X family phage/plasmid replication protein